GIYGNLLTRANVLAITARARAAGWRVMLGGPEPSNYADEFLDAGADVIVSGEGERALEYLMRANFHRHASPSIPGLIFRSATGEAHRTGAPQLLENLDAQPWPDRGAIDIGKYLNTWRAHHRTGSISIITARGCPFKCNWCSHSVYGHSHRRRSPETVVD